MESNELKLMPNDWVLRNCIETKVTPNMLLSLEVNPAFAGIIQPIKLTPEIMERIDGIEKGYRVDSGELKDCYMYFSLGFMIRHNSYYVDYLGGNFEVKYFHTLQQTIRLFTGEEIEVKWEK